MTTAHAARDVLEWTPASHGGCEANGSSGRYYSIVRHGSRFRLAAGGGRLDQKVGTLSSLKSVCEEIELAVISGR